MNDLNRWSITGRLGRDPEMRYTPNGQAVTQFNVAVGRSYKRDGGDWQEETEWARVVVWGPAAERAAAQLRKGSLVYVEGRVQTREWEKDGVKRHTTELIAQWVRPLADFVKRGDEGAVSGDEARRNVAAAREAFRDELGDLPF